MKELLRHFVNLSAQEYETFLHLSWRRRLQGTIGLALIYSVMLVLIFLALHPTLGADPQSATLLWSFLILVGAAFVPGLMPILMPRLIAYNKQITIGAGMIGLLFGAAATYVSETYELPDPIAAPEMLLGLAIGVFLLVVGLSLYGRVMKIVAAERVSLESEMRLAQSIQQQLLPPIERDEPHYRLHAQAHLAQDVGGDFFDAVHTEPERLLVAVGDVSGHDVGAGLMMATTKGAFRACADADLPPRSLTEALNRVVYDHGGRRLFVSFQCGLFDFERGVFQLVNAGHMPVLHYHHASGHIDELRLPAPALGLVRDATMETLEVAMAPGDAFLFYTDGLTEVFDADRQELGVEGVSEIFAREAGRAAPAEVTAALERAARSHAAEHGPHDDLTTLMVHVR